MEMVSSWISKNCRFAAENPVKPILTQRPETGLVHQPKTMMDEDRLQKEVGKFPLADVFRSMGANLRTAKEVLQYAKDPQGYPTFAEAFRQAYGDTNVDEALMDLNKLIVYFARLKDFRAVLQD